MDTCVPGLFAHIDMDMQSVMCDLFSKAAYLIINDH